MNDCFEDPEQNGALVYTSDPKVSCEGSIQLIITIHQVCVIFLVGMGLPLYILLLIRQEQRQERIDGFSPYTPLIDNYSPRTPWFDFVQLGRKGLLTAATTKSKYFSSGAVFQAVASLLINLVFLALLILWKPTRYFPTSWGEFNLYLCAELASAVFVVVGNVIAIAAALIDTEVDTLGNIFAIINISFFLLFVTAFHVDYIR